MKKIITFSIAAYNVQDYLAQCLDSFLVPECLNFIEVIIIDDGSTDRTADIASNYCKKYPDTFKLISKTNGGHGSTINTAIKIAEGKYFRPIDGDDWIKSNNLPSIISKLQSINNDYVICDFSEEYLNQNISKTISYNSIPKNQTFTFNSVEWDRTIPFHGILYKTEILQKNKLTVTEKIFYEDTEYALYPLPFIKDAYYLPLILYCYRLGIEGQSVSLESRFKHLDDSELILKNIFNFYSNNKEDYSKSNYYKKRIKESFDFYYKLTFDNNWFSEKKFQKNKIKLMKTLYKIDKSLFLFCIKGSKIKILQYITNYKFDKFFVKIKNRSQK